MKRSSDDDNFLGSHFTSTGELSVNENISGAGPDTLKHILVEHLLEGETITRALKRLRPAPKQLGNKKRRQIGGSQRHRAADAAVEATAFLSGLEGKAEDKGKDEEEKKRAFNQVTEAASELMELGYEDIYTITREAIRASTKGGTAGSKHKSMYIWHDDGMSAPRKRDHENDITSFKDLPRSHGSEAADDPSQKKPDLGNSRQRDDITAEASKAAAGAVSYQKAVPFHYPEPPQTKQAKPLRPPKMARLPPPPGGFRGQTFPVEPGPQPHQSSQPAQYQPYPAHAPTPAAPGCPQYPMPGPGQYGRQYMQPWPQEQWQYPQGQSQQPQYPYEGQYNQLPSYNHSGPSPRPT